MRTPRRTAVALLVLATSLVLVSSASARPRDRDRDRLPDSWEKRYQISTKKRSAGRDIDRDRLSNLREYRARTHPRRADTDRDGLDDYAEVIRYKTDPRRVDTDRDGARDGAEVRAGSDPRQAASRPPEKDSSPSTSNAADCTEAPNTPDGPDPWGGCFPGPARTGVPAGVELSPYTGPCRITTPNTVIDSKIVNCYLDIYAPNVQIRNTLVNGRVWVDNPTQGGSFTITDSTIDAGAVDGSHNDGNSAIGKSHFTATRVETIRGIRGIWCEYDCTVQDSYVHGQDADESGKAHESGIRMGSGAPGAGQRIAHTTIACDAPDVPPDAGCSAGLTGYGDFAPIQNNLVERNLFLASTGGTCAYGGSTAGKPHPDGSDNVFRENVFQRGRGGRGRCGYWSAVVDLDAGQRGNEFSGNRWDTGELMSSDGGAG
jgi:hypothetical protein